MEEPALCSLQPAAGPLAAAAAAASGQAVPAHRVAESAAAGAAGGLRQSLPAAWRGCGPGGARGSRCWRCPCLASACCCRSMPRGPPKRPPARPAAPAPGTRPSAWTLRQYPGTCPRRSSLCECPALSPGWWWWGWSWEGEEGQDRSGSGWGRILLPRIECGDQEDSRGSLGLESQGISWAGPSAVIRARQP